MWSKSKLLKRLIFAAVGLVFLASAAYLLLAYGIPYWNAENTMDPDGCITIYELDDGSLQVQWPQGRNADSHTLQVLRSTQEGEQLLYAYTTSQECSHILPELPRDEELTLRVTSSHRYRDESRPGDECLEAVLKLAPPAVEQLSWTVDPDTDQLNVSFEMEQGDVCHVYRSAAEGEQQLVQRLTDGSLTLSFGDGQAFAIPEYNTDETFTFAVYRQRDNYIFYGNTSGSFPVSREDFLGTVLQLTCTEAGSNAYTLTWNETKGKTYDLQISQDEGATWQTLCTVSQGGERVYTTDHLAPFSSYQFRITAAGSEFTVRPDHTSVTTCQRTLYSTIWPLISLDVYADTARTQVIGTASAGTAYCVLDETDGLFAIRFKNSTGYIDSNYCMINLPEYIGGLCAYNITNSHNSIYLVHEFVIDQVTDTVIAGYEDVQLAADEYLVPLLYPAAQKLVSAALAAQEQGYRLKIYDSFRPREATLSIYELTELIIETLVPKDTFSGEPIEDLDQLSYKPEEAVTGTTEPENTEPSAGSPSSEEAEEPEYLMEGLTYQILMTDSGRYDLSNFLAKGISNHNLGVAVDLTLETLAGEELEMQTAMHDLSWYSEPARNNENADLLKSFMVSAGFGTLKSEWWHFQDNHIKTELNLSNLYEGVSAQCWVKDDHGWRYRLSSGAFVTDCTKIIDGTAYIFDEAGYAAER